MVKVLSETIKSNNWVQGVLLDRDERKFIISNIEVLDWVEESDVLVLFTQDCDLVNLDLAKEPFAEFFCAKVIPELLPQYAYGKNPRVIHLKSDQGRFIRVDINHRVRIDRSLLTKRKIHLTHEKLNQEDLDILLDWFSKKYSRAAFPDAFNTILKSIKRLEYKLRKFDQNYPEVIRIFFKLTPENEELYDESSYGLEIILLMKGISPEIDDDEKLETIRRRFQQILSHQKLKIWRCECLYENEMTMYDLGYYKLWDKDYISFSRTT